MTTRSITISEALDMAVAKLPPLRRSVMRMRLRSDGFRTRTLAELRLKLSDDADCCALMGTSFGIGLADETFGDATPFTIELGNLEQFLQLILKYLPQILEIIFKLFAAVAFIAATLSISGSANAQMVCANGQCQLLRTTAAVATAPVRAVANVVYPNYPAVSSASGYGSSGAQAVQSYGSQGSQAASGGSAGSNQRWRLGDRIRENVAARKTSRAASYGSAGSSVQGYGCSGSQVLMMAVQSCTCSPCNCAPSSPAPAAPVAPPLTFSAPLIALPPEQAVRELYVQVFPK